LFQLSKIIQFQLQFQFHVLLLSFSLIFVLSTRLQIMFNDNLILSSLFSKAHVDSVN